VRIYFWMGSPTRGFETATPDPPVMNGDSPEASVSLDKILLIYPTFGGLMRKIYLLGIAIVCLTAFAMPAAAKTGAGNSWTQLMNGNYPTDSSNPNCSPCVKWPDYYESTWSNRLSSTGPFHTDAIALMKEWSGQPYKSPVFNEGSRGCVTGNNWDICLTTKFQDKTYCGIATLVNSGTAIAYVDVFLNSNWGYYDGPVPPGQTGCDLRRVYAHELGHAFSEGHSAIRTDLMCGWLDKTGCQGSPEHVDADAKAELNAVYGPLPQGGSGCPCLDLAQLKEKLLQEAQALSSVVGDEYVGEPAITQ